MKTCAALIVKNEAAVIRRCMQSLLGKVDQVFIADTGSTDGTVEAAAGIFPELVSTKRPWVNFGHNRTELVKMARDNSDYLLLMDADQTLEGALPRELGAPAYNLNTKHGRLEYQNIRLVRNSYDWRYVGATHEYITCDEAVIAPLLTDCHLVEHADSNRRTSGAKLTDDIEILKQERKRDPYNARTVFYLARSYDDYGMPDAACTAYNQRASMGGYRDEIFYSLLRVGQLTLPKGIASLFRAMNVCPHRWEPIHAACKHLNSTDCHQAAYSLSSMALARGKSPDGLFVHAPVYDHELEFEHTLSAYYVGQYRECHELSLALLERSLPMDIRVALLRNMTFLKGKV